MTMRGVVGVGVALAAGGLAITATAQELRRELPMLGAPAPAAVEMLEAREAGGLKISLAAAKNEIPAGETVKLTLTFENVSKESLRVFRPISQVADDYLEVRVAGPKVLRSGMQARNMMAWLPGPQAFPELKPGEKTTFEFVLTGNPPAVAPGGVILGEAGTYKIQVAYTYQGGGAEDVGLEDVRGNRMDFVPWRGNVISAPIEIKVTGEVQEPGPRRQPGRMRPMVRPMAQPEDGQQPNALPVPELPNRPRRTPVTD